MRHGRSSKRVFLVGASAALCASLLCSSVARADAEETVASLQAQLAQRDAEIVLLRQQLERKYAGTMEPTLVELHGVDAKVPFQPSFHELHEALYGKAWDEQDNLWKEFPNFYGKQPDFSYTHSPFWGEGIVESFFTSVRTILKLEGEWKPRFMLEIGTFFGMSAIRWAQELDRRNLTAVPLLCIDPFAGDLNMWLNKHKPVWKLLDVRHARPLLYEQFMANVGSKVLSGEVGATHILPFPVTAITAARWLQFMGYQPDTIFLDSAHEVDETYLELALYYRLLAPGGIIFGDDYQWTSVKYDVDRFAKYHDLPLFTDADKRIWALAKSQ